MAETDILETAVREAAKVNFDQLRTIAENLSDNKGYSESHIICHN